MLAPTLLPSSTSSSCHQQVSLSPYNSDLPSHPPTEEESGSADIIPSPSATSSSSDTSSEPTSARAGSQELVTEMSWYFSCFTCLIILLFLSTKIYGYTLTQEFNALLPMTCTDPSTWSSVDNKITCDNCTALANLVVHKSCRNFCQSQWPPLSCVASFTDQTDTCTTSSGDLGCAFEVLTPKYDLLNATYIQF
ncbi:hypothetical protein TrST_g11085 [Triparma strigata]|uniref:Uncharacterized protein n=1 Tax=Triparma strigata TaxID=1606541 RepID=A0A9W7AGA6_9STRA|nr:hypothetical protein TrST_g11085 [Triparma strigata]